MVQRKRIVGVNDWKIKGSHQFCSVNFDNSSLTACHRLVPSSTTNWFNQGHAMCYHIYEIMHVKDTQLTVVRVGHRVPFAELCLSLYDMYVLNGNVNMIQTSTGKFISWICELNDWNTHPVDVYYQFFQKQYASL